MIIIGRSSETEVIVKCTDEELLRIQGIGSEAMKNMFNTGKIINVSEQYEKLKYFSSNAGQLKNVVQQLKESAASIEAAMPKEEG